jgi:hypothetical protein
MGIDYSIKLYYRIERLEAVLLTFLSIAAPIAGALTTIELPNHRSISVPFNSGLQNRSLRLRSQDWEIMLDTRIVFAVDLSILAYLQACGIENEIVRGFLENNRSVNYVSIGYIYLKIRAGYNYVELSFTTETSHLSKLFSDSGAIQAKFIDFMNETDGLFGILDLERDDYLLLTDLARKIDRPTPEMEIKTETAWDIPYYEEDIVYDIDLFVVACLQQI